MLGVLWMMAGPSARADVLVRLGAADRVVSEPDLPSALQRARVARSREPALGPITIELPPGTMRIREPIGLSALDSGRPDAPLTIRGAPDGRTTISGAVAVGADSSVDESKSPLLKPGLDPMRLSLGAVGLAQPARFVTRGPYSGTSSSRMALFQGDRRLVPSRYPKTGFSTETKASQSPDASLSLALPAQLLAKWSAEPEPWLGGYWSYDWAQETLPARVTGKAVVTIAPLRTPFPPKTRPRWFAFNLWSELDRQGEFVLDTNRQRVSVLPYDQTAVDVAVAPTLVQINSAANIVFERLAFEKTLGNTIEVNGSQNIVLRDCFVGHSGAWAIVIDGGKANSVERCVVTDTSEGGIVLAGGDRRTLSPAGHKVSSCIISNFGVENPAFTPGVKIEGVGSRLEDSLVTGSPHAAVMIGGNDHVVQGNEIAHVVRDTDDAGAIYMGRDWTARGMVIANNFIHDVGGMKNSRFVSGVYLDDNFSGVTIKSNVFFRVPIPVVVGGGRDNTIDGNIFSMFADFAIFVDSRGENTHRVLSAPGGDLWRKLQLMPYRTEPWASRYPDLVNIAEQHPEAQKNNQLTGNVALGGKLLLTYLTLVNVNAVDTQQSQIGAADEDLLTKEQDGQQVLRLLAKIVAPRDIARQVTSRADLRKTLLYAKKASF